MRELKVKRLRQACREKGISIEANGFINEKGQRTVSKGRKAYQQAKKEI